jgi:hypothetical protein
MLYVSPFTFSHYKKIREEFSMEKLTDISIINISFHRPSKTTSSSSTLECKKVSKLDITGI